MSETASRSKLCCRVLYSVFGILIGIAGIAFLVAWDLDSNNRYASVTYAGLSGVLAGWNLILHVMHLQDLWRTWLKGLRLFVTTGAIFVGISVLSFLIFLILAITKNTYFTADSFYLTAILCAWCGLWAMLLFWHSKKYRNEFADLTALLDF